MPKGHSTKHFKQLGTKLVCPCGVSYRGAHETVAKLSQMHAKVCKAVITTPPEIALTEYEVATGRQCELTQNRAQSRFMNRTANQRLDQKLERNYIT